MSYDLMVFKKIKAPINKVEFLEFYKEQVKWKLDHNYASIEISSRKLNNCYVDIIMIFPSTNGDFAIEDDILENNEELESCLIDYSICRNPIYVVFVWSQAEKLVILCSCILWNIIWYFYGSRTGEIIISDTSNHSP